MPCIISKINSLERPSRRFFLLPWEQPRSSKVTRTRWKRQGRGHLLSALLRYVPLFYFASRRPLRIPGHYRLCLDGFRLGNHRFAVPAHRQRCAVHTVPTLVFLSSIPLIPFTQIPFSFLLSSGRSSTPLFQRGKLFFPISDVKFLITH